MQFNIEKNLSITAAQFKEGARKLTKNRIRTLRPVRDLERRLKPYGLRISRIKMGGKHPKITVTDGVRSVTRPMPSSPSDYNWIRNKMAEILRYFR